jgi:hypothetical protein
MKTYKSRYEDERMKNRVLELKYRGKIAELEERENERGKAVDLLIAALKNEQDSNIKHMQLYLESEKDRKDLVKKLKEAEWKINGLEKKLAEKESENK